MTDGDPARATSRPPLLVHYHIFKNAGCSVDRMLRDNFGGAWREQEFEVGARPERHAQVCAVLANSPELAAFSSHTAPMPVPELPHRHVVPIVFVRHPLLRIRSAYDFLKVQPHDLPPVRVARSTDIRGFIRTLLRDPDNRTVRDFQVLRFAAGTRGRPRDAVPRALETASRLPFVGLVEAYAESVARFGGLVAPILPGFRAVPHHENASAARPRATAAESLAALEDELGRRLYDRLMAGNAGDLELYDQVRATYPSAG